MAPPLLRVVHDGQAHAEADVNKTTKAASHALAWHATGASRDFTTAVASTHPRR